MLIQDLGRVLTGKTGKIQAVGLYISKFSKNFVRIPGWGRGISGKTGKIQAVDLYISRF